MNLLKARIGKPLSAGFLCLFVFNITDVQAVVFVPSIHVTDVNTADANSITAQNFDGTNRTLTVGEDYNEKFLLPYPSHDGWAVVNSNGGYFDKVVTLNGIAQPGTVPNYSFNFSITNTGPYTWSDYHFEFWNPTFTQRLASFPVDPAALTSTIFNNSALAPRGGVPSTVAEFWAPNWQSTGQTGEYTLSVNLAGLVDQNGNGSFGIRQVATTVPEPETYAMLLAGFGVLGFMARRKAQQAA